MSAGARRAAALGGVLGPAAFVAAWAVGGAVADGYDPAADAISRLAAVGAPTRPLMTAGLVAFGVGVGAHAVALRRGLPGPAWAAAAATAAATLAVAATPLDAGVDALHGLAAGAGYATLAAAPAAAAGPLARGGHRGAAAASVAAAAVCGGSLLATVLVEGHHGLLQRVGLTAGDAWLVASGLVLLARDGRGRPAVSPAAARGGRRGAGGPARR